MKNAQQRFSIKIGETTRTSKLYAQSPMLSMLTTVVRANKRAPDRTVEDDVPCITPCTSWLQAGPRVAYPRGGTMAKKQKREEALCVRPERQQKEA